jgi:hypothetical protein
MEHGGAFGAGLLWAFELLSGKRWYEGGDERER